MADEMNLGGAQPGGSGNRPGIMRRIGDIALGGLKETGSSYFSNIANLKADADTIKTQVIQDGKTVIDVFNRFKNNAKSPGKKIRDWFYTDDMMFGGFDSDNDDFDAGFKIDDADSATGEEKPKTLDVESMTDIAKKQSSEAHKVAAKQAEMSMANTAEIVSAINSRSAELTASLNKVNDTLLAITKTLDSVYKLQTQTAKRQEESQIFDYNGQLSAAGIFNAAYGNFKEDKLGGLDMAKMMLKSLTPKNLAAMGLDKLFSIEIPGTDGKSIKSISEGINNAVGDAIQTGLMALVKNERFARWFGDPGGHRQGVDYSKYATNQYNTKPAVFDGMTRQTIVHIIPEYLKSIEAAITGGAPKSIDERGRLTTKSENHFQNTIQKSLFSSSTYALSDMQLTRGRVQSFDSDIKSEDIRLVVDAIKLGFEIQIEVSDPKHGNTTANGIVDPKELDPANHAPRWELAVQYAVMALSSSAANKKNRNWKRIISIIFTTLDKADRTALANEITRDAAKVSKNSMEFAATSPFAAQAGKITKELLMDAFRNRVADVKQHQAPQTTAGAPVDKAKQQENKVEIPEITGTSVGNNLTNQNIPKMIVGELDAIRQILSRGLNVFVTGMANINTEQDSAFNDAFDVGGVQSFGNLLNLDMQFFAGNGQSSITPASSANNIGGKKKNKKKKKKKGKGKSPVTTSSGAPVQAVNPNAELITSEDLKHPADIIDAAERLESGEAYADPETTAAVQKAAKKLNDAAEAKAAKEGKTTAEIWREGIGKGVDAYNDVVADVYKGLQQSSSPEAKAAAAMLKGFANNEKRLEIREEVAAAGGKAIDYVGGKVDSAKSFLGGKIASIGNWIGGKKDQAMTSAMGKMEYGDQLEIVNAAFNESNDRLNDRLRNGSDKEQASAKEDQIIMQQIQTYVQGAGENGFTAKEVQDIQKLVQQIHDKKIKTNMLRYTIPMMKNNSPEIKEKEATKKTGSILGNFLKGSGRYIGLLFKPVTLLLGAGLKILTTISGLILKISGALIKSGAKDVYYGARSLGGGLFGSKKEGEESMGLIRRTVSLPRRLGAAAGALTGISWEGILKKLEDGVVDLLAFGMTQMGKLTNWLKNKTGNLLFGKDGKGGLLGENGVFHKVANGISTVFGATFSGLLKSGFWKGLTSASRAKKEAKMKIAAANLRTAPPQNKEESELQAIREEGEKSREALEQIAENTDPERQAKLIKQKADEDKKAAQEEDKRKKKEAKRAARENTTGGKILNRLGQAKDAFTGGIKGGSLGLDLGKMIGGIGGIGKGILKMLAGALTGLSGFKVLMNTISKLLTSTLRPMNSTFHKLTITLKPVLITMRNSLKAVMKSVSDICKMAIDILQPIFQDVLQPFFEQLGPVLLKFTKMIQDKLMPVIETIMKTILAPLFVRFVTTLLPAIELIAAAVQVAAGLLESIAGCVYWIYGKLAHKEEAKSSGKEMMAAGWDMMGQGFTDMKDSFSAVVDAALGKTKLESTQVQQQVVEKETPIYAPKGSIFDGVVGSGDSQSNYGGYMGMNKHGCGPTALADMVSRRTGSRVSATGMASAMSRNGTYNQGMGTSVGGYLHTANAMGMGLRAGGVTNNSLKRATPNNPVTLVGSGTGFGTRSGNNHYVNVIGSGSNGTSYVMNPMSGRVERRSTSDLVSHSVLGLYGSGDEAPKIQENPKTSEDGSATNTTIGYQVATGYSFPDAIQDAMDYLKDLAKSLLSIFTGPDEAAIIQQQIDDKNSERLIKETKKQLGDEYQQYEDEARQAAYADYASQHPKKDSETQEEYEAKQEKYFQEHILSYLAATKAFELAKEKGGDTYAKLLAASEKMVNVVDTSDWQDSAYSGAAGGDGVYGLSEDVKMYPFGDPEHRSVNITSGESGESPVHDFFGKMAGAKSYSSSNYQNWYSRRCNPNTEGVGSSGDTHNGLDIQWEGGNAGKPLFAITDGIVTAVRDSNSSCGNAIRWKDASGRYEHMYMHMRDPVTFKEGDKLAAGTMVGHVGNTGASGGAHLHYGIYDGSGWDSTVNPLTYWKWHKGKNTGTNGDLPGSTRRDKIWSFLVAPTSIGGLGLTKEGAAGVLGNMQVESASDYEPMREEGNYAIPITDTSYADSVNSGSYSRDAFANDAVGFGLVQWTTSDHKGGLYDYLKTQKSVSIGDLRGQLEYLGGELDNSDFAGVNISKDVINSLRKQGVSVYDNMYSFLTKFENPRDWATNARIRGGYAQEIYDYYKDWDIPKTLNINDNTIVSSYDAAAAAEKAALSSITSGSGLTDNHGNVTINSIGDAQKYAELQENAKDTTSQLHIGDIVIMRDKFSKVDAYGDYKNAVTTPEQFAGKKFKIVGFRYNGKHKVDLYDLSDGTNTYRNFSRDSLILSQTADAVAQSMTNTSKKMSSTVNNSNKNNTVISSYTADDKFSTGTVYKTDGAVAKYSASKTANDTYAKDQLISMYGEDTYNKYNPFAKLSGNGDFQIESFIGQGDPNAEIPPVNADLAFWNEMGFGTGKTEANGSSSTPVTVVRTDDTNADKRINAVLRNTFEVKSKTIESYLKQILEAVESRGKTWSEAYDGTQSNTKLFDEHIPSQVAKLSIG